MYTLAHGWQGAFKKPCNRFLISLDNNGEALRPLRFLWKYVAYQEAANDYHAALRQPVRIASHPT